MQFVVVIHGAECNLRLFFDG